MALHTYPGRLLVLTGTSSALLLILTVGVAASLNAQQQRTADALNENIGSRRAAADLRETLTELAARHKNGDTEVGALQSRAQTDLEQITSLADKPRERELAAQVRLSFEAYLRDAQPPERAGRYLDQHTVPACDRLREFNATEIETSERAHRAALRALAWGFVAVGVLGSGAGLVFGYGLARGLRRAVDSLLIRIQDASGALAPETTTVEWGRDGSPPPGGLGGLAERVEQVVSRLQQREREARRAEQLATVGLLAAGVAHEIRNPLTSVQLLVQTVRRDPAAGALTPDDLALIDDELGRIEQSLRTFLDFARPPALERAVCDLTAVVESAAKLVRGRAQQQGVAVRVDAPAPMVLSADQAQLRQVIVNLLLNALEAMPAGGVVGVAVRAAGGGAEVKVSDTGHGIAPDVLPRLFEPFATGKETGLGLGLVVSRRIAEDHGGTVRGANREGGGAVFTVRLPLTGTPDRGGHEP